MNRDSRKELKEVQARIEEGTKIARGLLYSQQCQDYLKKCEDARTATIQHLIRYRNPDPIEYAFYVQGLIRDLSSLEKLGVLIKQDAKAE